MAKKKMTKTEAVDLEHLAPLEYRQETVPTWDIICLPELNHGRQLSAFDPASSKGKDLVQSLVTHGLSSAPTEMTVGARLSDCPPGMFVVDGKTIDPIALEMERRETAYAELQARTDADVVYDMVAFQRAYCDDAGVIRPISKNPVIRFFGYQRQLYAVPLAIATLLQTAAEDPTIPVEERISQLINWPMFVTKVQCLPQVRKMQRAENFEVGKTALNPVELLLWAEDMIAEGARQVDVVAALGKTSGAKAYRLGAACAQLPEFRKFFMGKLMEFVQSPERGKERPGWDYSLIRHDYVARLGAALRLEDVAAWNKLMIACPGQDGKKPRMDWDQELLPFYQRALPGTFTGPKAIAEIQAVWEHVSAPKEAMSFKKLKDINSRERSEMLSLFTIAWEGGEKQFERFVTLTKATDTMFRAIQAEAYQYITTGEDGPLLVALKEWKWVLVSPEEAAKPLSRLHAE